jgi:hypothetical protein
VPAAALVPGDAADLALTAIYYEGTYWLRFSSATGSIGAILFSLWLGGMMVSWILQDGELA